MSTDLQKQPNNGSEHESSTDDSIPCSVEAKEEKIGATEKRTSSCQDVNESDSVMASHSDRDAPHIQSQKLILVDRSKDDSNVIVQCVDPSLLKCVRTLLAEGSGHSLMMVGDDQVLEHAETPPNEHQVTKPQDSGATSSTFTAGTILNSVNCHLDASLSASTLKQSSSTVTHSSNSESSRHQSSNLSQPSISPSPSIDQSIDVMEIEVPTKVQTPTSVHHQLDRAAASSLEGVKPALDEVSSESPLLTTSHSSEQLLNFAKKLIQDKGLSERMALSSSVDESKCIIMPDSEKTRATVGGGDSVITMYLSSPNELKQKLEKLKTNSPVIVMQAGEDLLSAGTENSSKTYVSDASKSHHGDQVLKVTLEACDSVPTGSAQGDGMGPLSSLTTSPVVYRCAECDYSSHNKHYYKQHVDLVHNTERPHKCPLCDYAGKRKHALLEHMVVHSNQRPFVCEHCNASFRKKGHLTNHIKLHTSQRLVQCTICNIQLPDSQAFEQHLRKIHNTDRLFKCRICDLTLVDREAMLRHLLTHGQASKEDACVSTVSCSLCSAKFDDLSALLDHKEKSHGGLQVAASSVNPSPLSTAESSAENQPVPFQANVVCSVCGFVCSSREAMKSHMWMHLEKSSMATSTTSTSTTTPLQEHNAEDRSTLGVLKRNVHSGQKSLPENVTYQCAACSFASNDNSVFIKHMLAHKTQQKKQQTEVKIAMTEVSKPTSIFSSQGAKIKTKLPISDSLSAKDGGKMDVPFIYDQSAGRYRCVICGYHCEFQRTIKAHIWKHSGHQNIQYPMFDSLDSSQANSGKQSSVSSSVNDDDADLMLVTKRENMEPTRKMSQMPVLKTPSGKLVPLMPLESVKTNYYNPQNVVQLKDNSVLVPASFGKSGSASKILKSLAFTESASKSQSVGERPPAEPTTRSSPGSEAPQKALDKAKVSVVTSFQSKENKSGPITVSTSREVPSSTQHVKKQVRAEDSGVEPGVVVETVDSVPCSLGLTGMKSQQGSPRVSDLEGSGNDSSLMKLFQSSRSSSRESGDSEKQEMSKEAVAKTSLLNPVDGGSMRLRCPKCDCILLSKQELTSHLPLCTETIKSEIKIEEHDARAKKGSRCDSVDSVQNEDSDATASSDEQGGSGEPGTTGNPQKTGICSSLLAVIEQLRERSQSEGDDSKPVQHSTKGGSSGGRKRTRQVADLSDLSVDDVQNIEKISDVEGDKYRCKLCHYTSQRICNMKLHMKTHRQKKPSECSLCDFSSSSPEALQEHMLKHCKVRTYACKFCPQNFNHKSTLRAHLRAHKDQEPFLCAYCVFETTSPMEFRDHMQVHSGCSSRLRCPICDNISSNKEELTSHLAKCKRCKKWDSSKCSEAAGDSDNSDKAEDYPSRPNAPLVPSQHACVVHGCSFVSSNLKDLQDHLSVHCNPSLLVCNLCDFKALHSRSLKSHMKRHANDQRYVQQPLEQYKCNLCGYVCHHLPSLKSHMWRHASDQSYSYEFTNDIINAAIDYDTRLDMDGKDIDDPELIDRVISSERKILEGQLTGRSHSCGQKPICWVTFRCCSCGFETINKPKLNIHMRTHSDIIQKALDVPRKAGQPMVKAGEKHRSSSQQSEGSTQPTKIKKQ